MRFTPLALAAAVGLAVGLSVKSLPVSSAVSVAPRLIHAQAMFDEKMPQVLPGINALEVGRTAGASAEVLTLSSIGKHMHQYSDEFVYVVEGSATGTVGTTKVTINPGDLLMLPRNSAHAFKATDGLLKVVVISAPPSRTTDFKMLK